MAQFAYPLGIAHAFRSDEREVQCADVMLTQSANRLPQLIFRETTKNLGRFALATSRVLKAQSPAPGPIIGAANAKLQIDKQISETEGGELMNDGLAVLENGGPIGLCRHQRTS